MPPTSADLAIWVIAGLATVGMITRPFKTPEAVWAVLGGLALLVLGLLPWGEGLEAINKGIDVCLFLTGMMLLSETARREGLFDWWRPRRNRGNPSPRRLFLLVYGVGVVVTTFLSNDAAAVVLTPAVFAAAKKAKVEMLPYLFICAFVANAASFVRPISNPAKPRPLRRPYPPLGRWLASFALPSAASIVATYMMLRWTEGRRLQDACECDVDRPALSKGGWTALAGIGLTAVVLLVVSALDVQLGRPTCVMGVLTMALVLVSKRGPVSDHQGCLLAGVAVGGGPVRHGRGGGQNPSDRRAGPRPLPGR